MNRTRPNRVALLVLSALVLLGALSTQARDAIAQEAGLVIYLMRHAETPRPPYDSDPPDPSLTLEGRERAARLATMLAHDGVTQIFSSDYRRTRETVTPLAEHLETSVEIYDPRELEAFAAELRQLSGRIVVVGHSNTTPMLVEALGGSPGEPIDDSTEFDRLYVLTLDATGGMSTVRLHY